MRPRSTHWYWLPGCLVTVVTIALNVGGGCTTLDTAVMPGTIIGPGTTSVSVDPAAFLGAVTCYDGPGGMESFVATLTDVDSNFVLASSGPTPCTQSAYFEYITIGDSYSAVVDGYDLPPDQLVGECGLPGPAVTQDQSCHTDADCAAAVGAGSTCQSGYCTCAVDSDCPVAYGCAGACILTTAYVNDAGIVDQPALLGPCGAAAPDGGIFECTCQYTAVEGSRQMYSKITGQPYAPRWQTPADQPCGVPLGFDGGLVGGDGGLTVASAQDAGDGVICEQYANVSVAPCLGALIDHGGAATVTAVQVIPYAALGALTCAASGGTVTGFDILPVGSTLAAPPELPCPSPDGTLFVQGVVADTSYMFTIQAYEGGATPTQQSSCYVTARAGITVTAACDPLVPIRDGGADGG